MFSKLEAIVTTPCATGAPCTTMEYWQTMAGALSDFMVALAYFSIFALTFILARRRQDVVSSSYRMVALFVLACGITHVVRLYNLLRGDVTIGAVVRIVTALISAATAIALWRLLPRMLNMPSATQLRGINEALRHEMAERRKVESALLQSQKMDAVGRVSGGIAHDFNNILQVISGNIQMMADAGMKDGGARQAELRALADAAQQSIDRGVRLTGQLMSFSQEQSFLLDLVHVADIAAVVPAHILPTLPDRISLRVEGGNIRACVLADATQLELAIANMATNAREAMPDGGELSIVFDTCHAHGRSDLADGDYLRIAVTDTGLGMSKQVADHAFDPFFTTKPAGAASGLGLSMVYGMARRSGGTATIESRPGAGTTIAVYLKLVPADTESAGAEQEDAPDRFDGLRVMLVDDEAPTRAVVAMTLESLDCVVAQAESGAQTLARMDAAADEWPDLFLLDYAMPGMTGAELATRLRMTERPGRFIFLTGFADFSAIRDAVGQDAIILQKPASRTKLARALARALDAAPTAPTSLSSVAAREAPPLTARAG